MRTYRADWILPIADEALRDGYVSIEEGRIAAAGSDPIPGAIDLGRVVVLPALVNAHTHLELSYLHDRVAAASSFAGWVREVMTLRKGYPDPADPAILDAARRAIAQAKASGTGLVGDVSNTLVTVPLLHEAGVPARVFHELTGFTEQDPRARARDARARADAAAAEAPAVRISLAPHAPYSVSAALFRALRAELDAQHDGISTVHLGEAPEEIELLKSGGGAIRGVLEDLGRWPPDWRPPGVSPVQYLSELGVLDSRMLVVHGVQFDGEDLSLLSTLGATLVSCPRSNVHVGVGSPPLEAFYAMDVDVAFGTDSLASVADLNMFSELAEARRIAPRVSARMFLESATRTAARALGFGEEYGSIEPGKRAALLAVRVPEGVTDVEEYLVSGVPAEAVTWLESD